MNPSTAFSGAAPDRQAASAAAQTSLGVRRPRFSVGVYLEWNMIGAPAFIAS